MSSTTQPTVGVGLVGWGYASTTFHAPLVQATPGMRLVAVSSSREQRVSSHPWDWVSSPEALLARTDVDLVVVPTPNATHHPLAAMALAAGKHVVVDKPFTLTVAQADDLIQRAQEARRVLSVFHNRRWDSDFLTLQAVLASGRLGRVTHLESHFNRFRPAVRDRWREHKDLGGGLWYDLGPHLLDQALVLWGAPQAIHLDTMAQREHAQTDDWFHALLTYPHGRVVLHASALTAEAGPRFVVHGTQGSFVKHGLDAQEAALQTGAKPNTLGWGEDPVPGYLTVAEGESVQKLAVPPVPGCYHHYYAQLRDAIRLGTPVPVPAEQAREVMWWLEQGLASDQSRVLLGAQVRPRV